MSGKRKITVEVPRHLLERAQQITGTTISEAVRVALRLVAAFQAYDRIREFRGRVRFSRTLSQLKTDR